MRRDYSSSEQRLHDDIEDAAIEWRRYRKLWRTGSFTVASGAAEVITGVLIGGITQVVGVDWGGLAGGLIILGAFSIFFGVLACVALMMRYDDDHPEDAYRKAQRALTKFYSENDRTVD